MLTLRIFSKCEKVSETLLFIFVSISVCYLCTVSRLLSYSSSLRPYKILSRPICTRGGFLTDKFYLTASISFVNMFFIFIFTFCYILLCNAFNKICSSVFNVLSLYFGFTVVSTQYIYQAPLAPSVNHFLPPVSFS